MLSRRKMLASLGLSSFFPLKLLGTGSSITTFTFTSQELAGYFFANVRDNIIIWTNSGESYSSSKCRAIESFSNQLHMNYSKAKDL